MLHDPEMARDRHYAFGPTRDRDRLVCIFLGHDFAAQNHVPALSVSTLLLTRLLIFSVARLALTFWLSPSR
jgi:hypothetical protein